MQIMVIGCRKVGSRLATVLSEKGHDVIVLDRDDRNFSRLSDEFTGITVTGVPIDRDVLKGAGIESCDAVAVVTDDDNVNIMASQIAKEIFGVKEVLTRIYDPSREDIFNHFGLETICPTNLTVEAVCNALEGDRNAQHISFGTNNISFKYRSVPSSLSGKPVSEILLEPSESILGVEHADSTMSMYQADLILQPDDKVIVSTLVD